MAAVENVVTTTFEADTSGLFRGATEIDRRMGQMAGSVEKSMGRARVATLALGAAVAGGTIGLVAFAKEAFAAAARVEELDIAMQAIGSSTGKGYDALSQATKAIRDNGIELAAAQQIAIEFAQNNLDLASAAKVARVAQDLAVIGAKNSTATTQLLTRAIITGRSELLKSAGISKLAGEAYRDYAKELGKATQNLTAAERQTAVINLILAEGEKVAGTYEASMNSAGKVLRSFKRLVNDLQIEIGKVVLKGFGPIIKAAYDLFSAFTKLFREGGMLYDVMTALQHVFAQAGKPIEKVFKMFKQMITPVKKYEELKAAFTDTTTASQKLIKQADRLTGIQRDLGDNTKYVTDRVQKFYDVLKLLVPLLGATLVAGATKFGASLLSMVGPLRFLVPLFNPFVAFIATFIALSPQLSGYVVAIVQAFAPFVQILKDFAGLIFGGLTDGVAAFLNVLSSLAQTVANLLRPITNFGRGNRDLVKSFESLRPIIGVITFALLTYGTYLVAAKVATVAFTAASLVMNAVQKASAVIIIATTAAFKAVTVAIKATTATIVAFTVATKALRVSTVLLMGTTAALAAALKVLRTGVVATAVALRGMAASLLLPITIIGLVIFAVYKLYQAMAKYFGEGEKTVDDFVYDIADHFNRALKSFSGFLNNISNFAAHVVAFFTKIGAVAEKVFAGDFAGAVAEGRKPLDAFLGDIMKFDLNIDGVLKNLKENKPASRLVDFVKDLFGGLTGAGALEEVPTAVEDGVKKATEDMVKAYEDAFKEVQSAQMQFAKLFDRPFGLEPSEIEDAYGVEGTTKSVISMSKQLQGAIMDMYRPLLNTELFSKKAVASARKNMENHLADLDAYTVRLHSLHRQREQIAKDLDALRETFDNDIRAINDKYDDLDKAASKNLQRLEKYYDNLIKGLRDTLDKATKAFDVENRKLEEIIGRRDQFLSRAADGLKGFVNALSFKSAADQIKKDGSRSNKIIRQTVKDIGNGIRVTVTEEIEPAMEELSGLKLTATDIRSQLQERFEAVREFAANIRALVARGLDKGLIEEFITAGAGQAGEVVSALAVASSEELAEINRIQSELQTQVASFTEYASAQFYDSAVAQQEAIVTPLKTAVDLAQQAFDNAEVLREAELTAAREQIEILREQRATALAEREAEYLREKETLEQRAKEIDAALKTLALEAYNFFVTLGNKSALDLFGVGKSMADNTRQGFKERFPQLKSKLNDLMTNLAESMRRETTITVTTVYRSVYEELKVPKAAMGARVLGTQAYLVGERGPELFMPSGAGQIIPAHETARALRGGAMGTSMISSMVGNGGNGGNTYVLNVNVPVSANRAEIGREIVDAITSFERRNGKVYEPA